MGVEHTGRRGRPRKTVDMNLLLDSFAPGSTISKSDLAKSLRIDRHTLSRVINEKGIDTSYSNISDDDLDTIVSDFLMNKPESGYPLIHGHIRSLGLKVRQIDVLASRPEFIHWQDCFVIDRQCSDDPIFSSDRMLYGTWMGTISSFGGASLSMGLMMDTAEQ